jgi:HEAT repeat protein
LNDDNPLVRHAAAYALGEMGPRAENAVPSLISKLGDTDSEVRSSSATSLLLIGYPSVAAMSNVVDHGDASSRQAAVVEFLRFYRSLRSMVPPLMKMAHAEQPEVRRSAITALGLMRSAEHDTIQTFKNACHDPVLNVRLAAVSALGLVPNSAADAVAELTHCLDDPSVELAISAARVLGTIGPGARSALPQLRQCYSASQDPLRVAAQAAIEKITCDSSQNAHLKVPSGF